MVQGHADAIEYYLRGHSRERALVKAGYTVQTARKAGYKVWARPDVQAALQRRVEGMKIRTEEAVARVTEELMRIAFFNIGNVLEVTEDGELIFNFEDVTLDDMAAIGEVTVETYTSGGEEVKRMKVKPLNKLAALESLAKIYGMMNDASVNVNINGTSLEERLVKGRERLKKTMERSREIGGELIEGEYDEL